MLAQKANCIDNIIEKRDSSSLCCQNVEKSLDATAGDPIAYTHTFDKAYHFFQDGHVQNVRYNPMPTQPDFVCISASVLPSMKKDKMYNVFIVLSKLSAKVKTAFCVCPAGLSGCCNHVTATLYCVEDYFRSGISGVGSKIKVERPIVLVDSSGNVILKWGADYAEPDEIDPIVCEAHNRTCEAWSP